MLRLICLLSALLLTGPVSAQPATTTANPAALDRWIGERRAAAGIPGEAHLLIADGQVHFGASGVEMRSTGKPMTDHSPLEVGSLSKSFTALSVMQLVEQRKVSLDTPVRQYLPWFTLADDNAARAITVRQLLSHTSGLSMLAGNFTQNAVDDGTDALRHRVERLATIRPATRPGTHFDYSNANYAILGALVETVSGDRLEHYVRAHILDPIGMNDSYMFTPDRGQPVIQGHRFWFGHAGQNPQKMFSRGSIAQAGMVLSTHDLALYLAMMMNGRDDIVSGATKRLMFTPQPPAQDYGLGWGMGTFSNRAIVSHTGLNPGFEALMAVDPVGKRAFAILINASGNIFDAPAQTLYLDAAARALGTPATLAPGNPLAKFSVAFLAAIILLGSMLAPRFIRRWFAGKVRRPSSVRGWLLRGLLPSALLAGLAWFIVVPFPAASGASFDATWSYFPDLALIAIIAAAICAIWAIVGPLLLAAAQRRA